MSTKKLKKELENYYTQAEAAQAIGKTRETLWKWAKEGKIPVVRVGREVLIRKDDLFAIKGERTND